MIRRPQARGFIFVSIACFGFFSLYLQWNSREKRQRNLLNENPTFLGVPLVKMSAQAPPDSTVHCIGGGIRGQQHPDMEWLYRSCEFRNLCFDTNEGDFVLHPSAAEQKLIRHLEANPLVSVSTVSMPASQQVALGAVDPILPTSTNKALIHSLQQDLSWFPQVREGKDAKGYFELPETHIFVPFEESNPMSKKSLEQKDFLSIFTLLYEFGLEGKKPVLLRVGSNAPPCSKDDTNGCYDAFRKSIGVLGVSPESFSPDPSSYDVTGPQSDDSIHLICSKFGAAGLGFLMTGSAPIQFDGTWMWTHTVGRESTMEAYQKFIELNLRH